MINDFILLWCSVCNSLYKYINVVKQGYCLTSMHSLLKYWMRYYWPRSSLISSKSKLLAVRYLALFGWSLSIQLLKNLDSMKKCYNLQNVLKNERLTITYITVHYEFSHHDFNCVEVTYPFIQMIASMIEIPYSISGQYFLSMIINCKSVYQFVAYHDGVFEFISLLPSNYT
jgi:hypothetical protein